MSIKAYKGFNKDMTCRGFQFKEGKTYHEDEASLCNKGFHACLNPIDCLSYYSPEKSEYHEVELDEISEEQGDDSKICGKTIKIFGKLDVAGIVKAAFEFTKSKCKNKKEARNHSALSAQDYSALSAQDCSALSARNRSALSAQDYSALSARNRSALSAQDYSALSAQNYSALSAQDYSALSAQDYSALSAQNNCELSAGENSVISAFNSRVKAGKNSIITLAKRKITDIGYVITDYASALVDGKTIKPDTWYTLKNGKFVEVSEDEQE